MIPLLLYAKRAKKGEYVRVLRTKIKSDLNYRYTRLENGVTLWE